MPRTFWIKDFSGGLNNKFRQNRIADNQLAAVRNARWSRFGALSKRLGTSRLLLTSGGSAIGIPHSLFSYQFASMANEQLLIGDDAGAVYRVSVTGALSSPVSLTSLITGLTTTYEPSFAALGNKVYLTNGVETRSIAADNTTATPSGAPTSRWLTVHKNYLFYLNDPTTPNPSRLQWSNRGNGDAYTSTDFHDIYPNDGAYGSGLISFGDELIVFKGPFFSSQSYAQGSMYRIVGDVFDAQNPTFIVDRIPLRANVSLVHGRTARIYNGALIFWTNDGPYAYLGGGREPEPIGESIRGEIDNIETFDVHVKARRAAATVWRNRYICSIYNDGDSADLFNNRIYIYEDGKWWVDIISEGNDDFQAGAGTGSDWVSYRGLLYSGSGFFNVLRQWETAAAFKDVMDAGTDGNVNLSALTKEYDFEKQTKFKECYVHLRRQASGTLTLEFNIDQRGAQSNSVGMTAPDAGSTQTSSSNLLRKRVAIGRDGQTIQFRMYDSGNNDAEIYAIELVYD